MPTQIDKHLVSKNAETPVPHCSCTEHHVKTIAQIQRPKGRSGQALLAAPKSEARHANSGRRVCAVSALFNTIHATDTLNFSPHAFLNNQSAPLQTTTGAGDGLWSPVVDEIPGANWQVGSDSANLKRRCCSGGFKQR